jgi:hypothetical protein
VEEIVMADKKEGAASTDTIAEEERSHEGNSTIDKIFIDTHFDSIQPSKIYDSNKETFAYGLSKLVFGSLIASYILGFVAFALTTAQIQPDSSIETVSILFRMDSSDKSDALGPEKASASDLETAKAFNLEKSLALEVIKRQPVTSMVGLYNPFVQGAVEDIGLYSMKAFLVANYVLISLIYSMFTALIYFVYHQSVLFVAGDQRRASWDFILSLAIAILFGISMLLPFLALPIFILAVVLTLKKKTATSIEFSEKVADKIVDSATIPNINSKFGGGQHDETENTAVRKKVALMIVEMCAAESGVVRTWGGTALRWKLLYPILAIIAYFVLNFSFNISVACQFEYLSVPNYFEVCFSQHQMGLFTVGSLVGQLILLGALFVAILVLLTRASEKFGAGGGSQYKDHVDTQFSSFVGKIRNEVLTSDGAKR